MIQLPPGCTVTYAVWIDIEKLSSDVIEWFELVGGNVSTGETYYDSRGKPINRTFVQYGKAKRCHFKQDGTGGVRLHFHGDDVSLASMFLLKFNDIVDNHNMRETMERYERDVA